MSLLTMMEAAADRLGIVRPTVVYASTDQQIRQLLSLANQEGKELARTYPWQAIVFEKSITATATETQTSAIPTDFDRMLSETFYNRTMDRRVVGPMTAQEWAFYKGANATVIYDAFRIRGGNLLLAPTPTAGDTYVFEYVSKYWCTSTGGTTATQSAWAADTDVGILDEELMTLGIIWRFLRAKGLDYSEAFRTYQTQLMLLSGRDGGKRTVNMAGSSRIQRVGVTVPDGSWSL